MSNHPPPEVADGDCFPTAFRLLREGDESMRLCHGTVVRSTDGRHHSHAWVESTRTYDVPVLDTDQTMAVTLTTAIDKANGNDIEMPATVYRKIGQAHDVVEYVRTDAMRLAVQTGHFGPWHDDLDDDPAPTVPMRRPITRYPERWRS
jgi:hypothetical protein